MDRPEPGLVKWSPNPNYDNFLHINLQHRVVQLYKPTGHARSGRFDYERLSKHDDFPTLTTYDWSPVTPGLLAVGTGPGIVNLLRIDDNSNAFIELGLKMTRTCQAVAFNTQGVLAVGLDRVRMDQCLHIWDVSRLSSLDKTVSGFPQDLTPFNDSMQRLEPSVSVSSIKFFEDNPQTLVVGIKAQGLRIHDLREPGSVVNFHTRCNNNLAIDYADQNYFASSALDQAGIMVWDRRATSRPVSSTHYSQAVDEDDLPWGAALRLDQAIDLDPEPLLADNKHSFIRSLRYCRDHRGLLGVLSRTGQLKVLKTNRETSLTPDTELESSPELLQVYKSHEMDVMYSYPGRKNDRIVSFDWVTLGSPVLRPKLLVLRANGQFDILEQPSCTSDYLYKLVPWQSPHRGLEEGGPYHDIITFESSHASEMLAPLFVEKELSEAPIFGPEKIDLDVIVEEATQTPVPTSGLVEDRCASDVPLPESFTKATTTAERMRALRAYVKEISEAKGPSNGNALADDIAKASSELSISAEGPPSCRELHEDLLESLIKAQGLPRDAQVVFDHVMLLRAKERYLFDGAINRNVVVDDAWLRYVWNWIAGAEAAASDENMTIQPLDLSYLGVHSIWMNDLGRKPQYRLSEGTSVPDVATWEKCIGAMCDKRRLPEFDGVQTAKPSHRQLCLHVCRWAEADDAKDGGLQEPPPEYPTTEHTMATAKALFRGNTQQAIQLLKKASGKHPELLFVSLALQLIGNAGEGEKGVSKEQKLDFDEAIASKTDPYLRAISSLIATGDWTAIANQASLPLSDRVYVAVRYFSDHQLTAWLDEQLAQAVASGDIEGIVLTGISDHLVDILARYVEKFHDFQSAALITSICAPRYIDDFRCRAWRNAYRAYLQRHRLFLQRTKFEVESTKRSKRDGRPTVKLPGRQVALRCVYCDAETTLSRHHQPAAQSASASGPSTHPPPNPLMSTSINAGVSCPNCGRHLPRCVVCLEVVGIPRTNNPEMGSVHDAESRLAERFPTFCLKCEHVLHLDHARMWFQRHFECPVPECRCRCNFRANPELNYK